MNLPKTRKEALAQGSKHYFTGKPCKRGHFDVRRVNGKYCAACNRVWQSEFYNTPNGRAYSLSRKSSSQPRKSKLLRNNLSEVEAFYASCPPGYEIDHILPRNGKTVCGLHQIDNLQILPKAENRRKRNGVDPLTLEANVCVLPAYREYISGS